ncbi:SCO family protein [Frigidibacter sp. MR17.14]|uniref:SCO family protein n=1 Tax=Frigidibacter sp. MR17.14 TaxID=3126509 RepID=UPI003012C7E1
MANLTSLARLRLILWALVALAAAGALWLFVLSPRLERDATAGFGRGDYRLVTTDGQPFTEASLKGGPTAVFFGFTHCPDVCPTTLGDIATWKEALGPRAAPLRVVFVTVDPERDGPEVLGPYVSWVEGVTGVTGPRPEIDKAIRAFRIFARKVPLDGGGYTMDHSSSVLLFDAAGRFVAPIPYQAPEKIALAALGRVLPD